MGTVGFFQRRPLAFTPAQSRCAGGILPLVSCVNIEEYAFVPIARGFWKQQELWDGTYTLGDFMDIMELIAVMDENQRREEENERFRQQLMPGR